MENILLNLLYANILVYSLGAVFYLNSFLKNSDSKLPTYLTLVGFILNTCALIARTLLTGNLPLGNMFEFGLFFVWGIVLTYLIIEFKFKLRVVGILVLLMAAIMMIWLTFKLDPTRISPMMPALRSYWLHIHVFTAVIAYGALAVSFAVSLLYLIKDYLKNSNNAIINKLPALKIMEDLTYKIIFVAMPFLTLVIITGAVWAEFAWGRYWSWDPKETWALITWFIYAAYLHVRLMRGWKGRKAMILAVLGFMAVLFTFVGVTYLLPGLHSYT